MVAVPTPPVSAPPVKAGTRPWGIFFRQFWQLAGPYWNSERKWKARVLTAILLVLTVAQIVIAIAQNLWYEALFDSLSAKDMPRFLLLIGVLAIIALSNVAVVTTHLRVKRRLQVDWRGWLTRKMVGEWMVGGRHYQVGLMPGEHDNPDGRIAEDIRITTESAFELGHSLLYSCLLLISFTHILWRVSEPLDIWVDGVHVYVPGYLVWAAIVYSAIGTGVALLLGRPLSPASYWRQRAEADFRFSLARARENTLAIAFLHGEKDERFRFKSLFRLAVTAWDNQTNALTTLFLFITSWSVLSMAFPVLVAAPQYIAGTITLGILMQSAQAFQQMTGALSWPVENLAKVADWRASVERVQGLHESLEAVADRLSATDATTVTVARGKHPNLEFRDFAIFDPGDGLVVQPFSAKIEPGERVLICGDSGAALKLFKAVAGLWPWGRGAIDLPSEGVIFFLPQRPYLPVGSLRSILCYPSDRLVSPDKSILAGALTRVGLSHLAGNLEESAAWEQLLTAAEQQRLSFARLLVHRPRWIFIQEATDALDAESERQMMRLVEAEFPTATIITISHDRPLDAYHTRRLTLVDKGGNFAIEDAPIAAFGKAQAS